MPSASFITPIVQKADPPHSIPPPSPPSRFHIPVLPHSPHRPAYTAPYARVPLHNSIGHRARKDTRLERRHETSYPNFTMTAFLRILVAQVCKIPKNADLLLRTHRCLQVVNEEHLVMDMLKEQLLVMRQMLRATKFYLAAFQSMPADLSSQADIALQCQEDLNSMILETEASITVIVGFLSRNGRYFSPGSSVSYAV